MTKSGISLIETAELEITLRAFAQERNWEQFHSPKNVVMALTVEVAELVEVFQWLTEDESRRIMDKEPTATAVQDEIADVMIYLVRLASVLKIDLDKAVREKIEKNAQKYPVDSVLGK